VTRFIEKYANRIVGVLSGFDRLVLRGTLRAIAYAEGMDVFLGCKHVKYVDFGAYAEQITSQLKAASVAPYVEHGLPVVPLPSSQISKEEKARSLAAERRITEGPICVLKCVEPCRTFSMRKGKDGMLRPVSEERQCQYLYHYQFHPVFGFMNARIETWLPFNVQVCINGREWLARQLEAEGLEYMRQDNCVLWVEDFARAQALLDAQLRVNWPSLLDDLARQLNPAHDAIFGDFNAGYYWTTYQSEWATDVIFSDPGFLRHLYPRLVNHAITALGCGDVLRYLGRRVPEDGRIPGTFRGEVTSSLKEWREGTRIKHWVNGNSQKSYDKAYSEEFAALRLENTTNNTSDFRVYRSTEGDPEGKPAWRRLRKGIADQHRLCALSQKANERYADALASVDDSAQLGDLLAKLTSPTTWKGKRVRPMNPFAAEDLRLAEAVSRAEFTTSGLRNRDLQRLLFAQPADTAAQARRRSAWVTRRLRLLRAHGILEKVQKTTRYQVTREGRRLLTAILTARATPLHQLVPEHLQDAA